ncbi:MAG: endonuclease/exonuclease/phosphatase family protein [Anaerolineales bacterium]|nr:endonuclease/exonuclease/phosphatase family protein [Anaerolineales bacterium]
MGNNKLSLFVSASVLLFFWQAIRVIFSILFGIIYDQVFAGSPGMWLVVSNLLVILAFLAPLAAPRRASPGWLAGAALLAAVARPMLSVNVADVRLWGALVILASAGVYLVGLIRSARPLVLPALSLAILLDQLLRLAGWTYDFGLRDAWLPVQILWSLAVIYAALRLRRAGLGATNSGGSLGVGSGAAFGALCFIEASLLGLPNAVARWSGVAYWLCAAIWLGLALLWMALALTQSAWLSELVGRLPRAVIALLLPLGLALGYFSAGWLSWSGLFLAQAALLAGFSALFSMERVEGKLPGGGLALGMFFFLILNYFNAFAFTYPYSLPFMRGLGWLVYLTAALAAGIVLLVRKAVRAAAVPPLARPAKLLVAGVVALAFAIVSLWPRPVAALPGSGKVRVATYNIHYGYDVKWKLTLEDIAAAIEENQVDIIALQEVDTGRLTSYGIDNAYYLARRLGMEVFYLPTVERLTGIAVLHRGGAEVTSSRLLSSLQEQTGVAHVQLRVDDASLHAFGIWMGLSKEDTQRQINESLAFIGDRSPAVFGGDFNAEPGSPVYQAVAGAGFSDPFLELGFDPPPFTDPAVQPEKRIDFVWGRGLTPLNAWVADSLASDHRMVVVEYQATP